MATNSGHNPFLNAQEQLDQCAKLLKLDPNAHTLLRVPMRELHVSIPVKMDDGKIRMFQGFRVQHNNAKGPTKGGIRFHPDETIDTVRALSFWMTWKSALLDLPLGGAKGGVICNPKELSAGELERLSRGYVDQVWQLVGPEQDVPAPDVYTNPQIMAWMMDEYSKLSGRNQFGMITGKPLAIGGSAGRGDATARGGLATIQAGARRWGVDLPNAKMAIQGFGNAGYYAAKLACNNFGCNVVAVSDSKGGIHNDAGIDPVAVGKYKQQTGSVVGFPGCEPISNEDLLELPVDVLVPAALENVITPANAGRIQAKIVAELANGPTTPEADDILYKKDIHLIPDFLCNAGGVTVSYFEMVQNNYMYYWTEEEVYKRLEEKMISSFRATLNAAERYHVNMRQAAYVVAVERVVEAMRLRGWL